VGDGRKSRVYAAALGTFFCSAAVGNVKNKKKKKCKVAQNHTFIGIYGVHMVFLAGKSPYIRSYTVQIYGSGQPYENTLYVYAKKTVYAVRCSICQY